MHTQKWPLSYLDLMKQVAMNTCAIRQLNSIFSIVRTPTENEFIVSDKLGIAIRKKPNGYEPRSGLLIIGVLEEEKLEFQSALDIGTGEIGIIAHYLKARGIPKVTGCDLDKLAIEHASSSSALSEGIAWEVADLFPYGSYGVVTSNPPQMPMESPGKLHDYGGPDGRSIVCRIISEAPAYMDKNGILYLLCFDFLGVDKQLSPDKISLVNFAREKGLSCKVLKEFQRNIREGGQTEKNIPWIIKNFPQYKFRQDSNGNLYHLIYVLKLMRGDK